VYKLREIYFCVEGVVMTINNSRKLIMFKKNIPYSIELFFLKMFKEN